MILRVWNRTSGLNFMDFFANMFELTIKCEVMKFEVFWISSLETSFE